MKKAVVVGYFIFAMFILSFGYTNSLFIDDEISLSNSFTAAIWDGCNPHISVDKYVSLNVDDHYVKQVTVGIGKNVFFKISVNNTGNVPLNITVGDMLPPGLLYAGNATVNNISWEPEISNGVYYWNFTNVQSEESNVIIFQAVTVGVGDQVNNVNASSKYGDLGIYSSDSAIVRIKANNYICRSIG